MKVLILDDERHRHDHYDREYAGHEVWHAYTMRQFKDAWSKVFRFDVVSFDHDLAYSETGAEIAQWMVERMSPSTAPVLCKVHSWNPVGAEAIMTILRDAGLQVERAPFACATLPQPIGGAA